METTLKKGKRSKTWTRLNAHSFSQLAAGNHNVRKHSSLAEGTLHHMKNNENELRLPGVIVRSVQGRDRWRVFAVVGIDLSNDTAPLIVSDGRLHPLEQQKHKNPAHLRLLGVPVETDRKVLLDSPTNSEIAEICGKYEKLFGNAKIPLDRGESFDL